MSERAHTKGPWRAVKASHGPIDILDDQGRGIVTVYGGGVGSESKEANARLIAAAPDLYEALRWFIDDIDGTHTVMLDFDENVAKARAALAKASPSGDPSHAPSSCGEDA